MPGPSKAPRHLKLAKGTLQKCRDTGERAVLPVFAALPPPPAWMQTNAHAVREWRRLGPLLVANRLLDEGSISAFEMLCALYGQNVNAFRRGETPTAAHITAHRTLCGSLGLLAVNLRPSKPSNIFQQHKQDGDRK